MTRKKKGKVKHQAPKGSSIPTKTLGEPPASTVTEDALEPSTEEASTEDALEPSTEEASTEEASTEEASTEEASTEEASSKGSALSPFGQSNAPTTEEASTEEAERKPFRVSCDAPNLKVNSGDYLATSVEDAKSQFFKAAGILSTKHPVKVKPGEDLSDVFGDI